MEREPDFIREAAVIAVGIFFGGLALASAARLYLGYEARALAAAIDASTQQLVADQRQRDADALQARKNAEIANQAQLRRQAAATQAAADQIKQAGEADRLKEAAWSAYYQPSAKCSDTTQTDSTIECGNAHIRARREFEVKWAAEHR